MSISKNERERAIYRSRRKFQTDLQSDLATAEDNGRQIGRAEGRAEGRVEGRAERSMEIARNALQKQMSIDDVVDITGLAREEVERLADDM